MFFHKPIEDVYKNLEFCQIYLVSHDNWGFCYIGSWAPLGGFLWNFN